MNIKEIRQSLLKSFIGFLILTALVAIISVFSGEIGDTQGRILLTSLTISFASICSMSCAAFLEKRDYKPAGVTGMALAFLSAVLIIPEIWFSIGGEFYFRMTVAVVISGISFAHVLLLYLPRLVEKYEWIQRAAAVTIAILAIQIILGIWFEIESSVYYRIMTVTAIVVGLETLVIPILMKIQDTENDDNDTRERLVLHRVKGDIYRDSSGSEFKVTCLHDD